MLLLHVRVQASLVSSNAGFAEPAFQLIVSNFSKLPVEDDALRESKSKSLHSALHRLLRVNPLACSALLPVIVESFPHAYNKREVQEAFLIESLKVRFDILSCPYPALWQMIS